jgi:hypothetical protein
MLWAGLILDDLCVTESSGADQQKTGVSDDAIKAAGVSLSSPFHSFHALFADEY